MVPFKCAEWRSISTGVIIYDISFGKSQFNNPTSQAETRKDKEGIRVKMDEIALEFRYYCSEDSSFIGQCKLCFPGVRSLDHLAMLVIA